MTDTQKQICKVLRWSRASPARVAKRLKINLKTASDNLEELTVLGLVGMGSDGKYFLA